MFERFFFPTGLKPQKMLLPFCAAKGRRQDRRCYFQQPKFYPLFYYARPWCSTLQIKNIPKRLSAGRRYMPLVLGLQQCVTGCVQIPPQNTHYNSAYRWCGCWRHHSADIAKEMAKLYGIKVYTIGIGSRKKRLPPES